MDASIINLQSLVEFIDFLEEQCKEISEYREQTNSAFTTFESIYKTEIEECVTILHDFPLSPNRLSEMADLTREYLWEMRWIGWGNYEFFPFLDQPVNNEFPLAMIAYLSARLIDDAIDNHLDYKGKCVTLYGHLSSKFSEREAAAACVIIANLLYHEVLYKLMRNGHKECAQIIIDQYGKVIPGALLETFVNSDFNLDLYNCIIQRKSVAYDSILHLVFFRTLVHEQRESMISMMAEFSVLAQWLNDFEDEKDDLTRGQLNVLNAKSMNPYFLTLKIYEKGKYMWQKAHKMPLEIRSVWARRILDAMDKLYRILLERTQESQILYR